MSLSVSIIGAPSSAGAYAPGPERTPAAFRQHGLTELLEQAGYHVNDRGDTEAFRWHPDPAQPEAMNLGAAVRVAAQVADRVAAARGADELALVLGGDCSVELGTLAGALRHELSTGLIYIDLDVDLNAPGIGTGEGALGWMGTAHMLDLEGAEPALSAIGPRRPMLEASDILFFGADAITASEQRTIREKELEVISLGEVKNDPRVAATRAAQWSRRFKQMLIHLDVDVLSFVDFPLAENTRRQAGLTFNELSEVLAVLTTAPNWCALTITQANPNHAPDESVTFGKLNAMLTEHLARRRGC